MSKEVNENNEDDMMPYYLGKCFLREESNYEYRKIQYLLNKTYINFATYDEHLKLSWIKKLKLIANDANQSEMKLKITYQSDGNRINQNKEISVYLCGNFETIYLLFSGIIVRKMVEHSYKYK